jgi:hypothetical protein
MLAPTLPVTARLDPLQWRQVIICSQILEDDVNAALGPDIWATPAPPRISTHWDPDGRFCRRIKDTGVGLNGVARHAFLEWREHVRSITQPKWARCDWTEWDFREYVDACYELRKWEMSMLAKEQSDDVLLDRIYYDLLERTGWNEGATLYMLINSGGPGAAVTWLEKMSDGAFQYTARLVDALDVVPQYGISHSVLEKIDEYVEATILYPVKVRSLRRVVTTSELLNDFIVDWQDIRPVRTQAPFAPELAPLLF